MNKYIAKNKKVILIILLILAFLGFFFLHSSATVKPAAPAVELNYTDTISGSTTVYDFMSRLQSEGKIIFTEKNYTGMGKFIDTINGIRCNGTENWIYYVNGVEAQIGISNYKIKQGDILSWKYEKANY